jgi:ubiquinone biosynthesis protein
MRPKTRLNRNIRTLKRYRHVLGILFKYGFGHIIEQLNIDYYLHLSKRFLTLGKSSRELERLSQAARLRLALEELGPTFIKLGQLLSTRPDIFSNEIIEELQLLQDRLPPIPSAQIKAVIHKELGAPATEIFATFNETPLATASIAQVHRAALHCGTQVACKIRRPDIESVIETDIDIMMGLAYLAEKHLPNGAAYDPVGLVREFRRAIQRELDFSREARTIDIFANSFADDPSVRIPTVYWEQTGHRVLTMEYLDGIKISDVNRLSKAGYDLQTIANNGAENFLKQVFIHGLFHADPHPGNLLVLPGNVIGILDYGMVGRLDRDLKLQLTELVLAILQRDADRIISQLLYSGELDDSSDLKSLKRDLSEFIDEYYDSLLQDMKIGKILLEFIELLTGHHIKFPPNLILLARALIALEGLGRQLDPGFNMTKLLKPFAEQVVKQRYSATYQTKEALQSLQDYRALARSLPKDLKEFINRLNRNKLKVSMEHQGLERLISDLDKSSNRISFSLVIAALIIGSSLIMQSDKGPTLFGFPTLGLLGYSVAGVLGLGLAIAVLRSGRM